MPLDFSRKPAGFNTVTKARQFDELKAALLASAERVCRHLYPAGRKEGPEWCVGSVNGEKGHSFKINLKTGIWKEFDGGPGGNDMIALWALAKGIKQGEAYDEAAAWLGIGKLKTTPEWASMATPAQLEAAVTCELLEIAQQHRTDTPHDDSEDKWWLKVDPIKYEYFDGDGVLWATVRRWDNPKGGKRVRPWDHKTDEERWPEGLRPLYNIPQIVKTAGPIVLVEGEKCADHLKHAGHVATTMAGGSSQAKTTDWSLLRGRDVIRWADNDAAGVKWATETRVELEKVGVRSIRDVAIPAGVEEGWDCADTTFGDAQRLIANAGTAAAPARSITRKPLSLPAFADIPKRRFVYDTIYQRGTVTVTAGEGGSGKSALHVVEALCIATGRDLLETGKPIERCRVWMIALEDDETEMHRRIAAAMIQFGLDRSDVEPWLDVTTKSHAPKFLLAASTSDGVQTSDEAVSSMIAEITEGNIGVTMIDPYVYVHSINENDNMGQAAVMQTLTGVVAATDIAMAIVHHAKKPAANDRGGPSAGDIRGASAIVNSARHGRLVNTMSASDADKLGVPEEERYFYFRTTSVKANYSPKAHSGRWFKMHGVRLPNGAMDEDGDGVGVVTRWQPPDPFDVMGMTVDTLRAVQAEFGRAYKAGTPYRANSKALPWAGEVIGNEVGLEPKDVSDKRKIAKILKTWIENGALVEDMWNDGHQKRPIIRPGPQA
jgi:hypothetical protein